MTLPSLTLEFLGTGTSQGVPVIGCDCKVCGSKDARDKRLRTSALVSKGDTSIVIDTGPDFRQQMLRSGRSHVDAVLYTHGHMDHIAGLDDLRPINFAQGRHLPLYTDESTESAIRKAFHYAFSETLYPGVPMVRFERLGSGPFAIGELDVMPIHADHGGSPVNGFRFGSLAYLTDIKHIAPEELQKLEGLHTLVLNALRQQPHHSHLTLGEAVAIAKAVGARQTYFTHISHLLGRHEEISATLPGGMALAYDGLRVRLD